VALRDELGDALALEGGDDSLGVLLREGDVGSSEQVFEVCGG
jgi:hypothetical protein